MYISARERKIMNYLMEQTEEISIKRLSDEIDVSLRTMHRDLKGIERLIEPFGLILQKKAGTGIKLIGDDSQKEQMRAYTNSLSGYEYSSEERQTIVMSALLEAREPVKLISLATDTNVTISTISSDLDKVEERLASFGLKLIRKRGYGVEIIGNESAKRRAISSLFVHQMDEFELMSMIKENMHLRSSTALNIVNARLLGLINQETISHIESVLTEIKQYFPYTIADRAYIGLVVHIALAIDRMKQGEEIKFDADALEKFSPTNEYRIAQSIVQRLEEKLEMLISPGEVGYITMHLLGTKLAQNNQDIFEDSNFNLRLYIQRLIQEVGHQLQYDLTTNGSLYDGLHTHLRPAIYRIKNDMGIANPLLAKIQSDYTELFKVVSDAAKKIFPDIRFPDEEIGYIVIHFASELVPKVERSNYRALVICSSGIGTSKILATRLEYEIPGLSTRNISMFEWESITQSDYDIIVSTIPLKNSNIDYVHVSPLLAEDEVERIKQQLKGIERQVPQRVATTSDAIVEDEVDAIRRTMEYATAIHKLITNFEVAKLEGPIDKPKAMLLACQALDDKGVVEDLEQVLIDIKEREKLGGFGLPGTGLALFHTKTDGVRSIAFTILRVTPPIEVKGMDGSIVAMTNLLMMLSPKTTTKAETDVLSALSGLMVRDSRTMEMFETADEEGLLKTILTEFKRQFLDNN